MNRPSLLVLCLLACSCARPDAGPDVAATDVAGGPLAFLGRNAYSPDGRHIAYVRSLEGVQAVFVANADGSAPVRLTHGIWEASPVWSPDGQWVAYYSDDDADVWIVPSAGGEPRQLTSGPATDNARGWLPDGSGVVFYRSGPGGWRTLVAPLDGGPVRPLFDAPDGNVYASLSPDGRRYVYLLGRGGSNTLWVQDAAGGPARQLTTDGFEGFRTPHLWSPDSRFVLYQTRRTGTNDVWSVNVETGEQRQLTTDIRNDWSPAWSPDGRWVTFLSDRGGQLDVWFVSADGGEARRVTNDLGLEDWPEWAPDGRHIIYQVGHPAASVDVIPAAGGPVRSVVTMEGYDLGRFWLSPDDRTVLYQSRRSGNLDIWSVPLAGGEPQQLTNGPLDEYQPRYSPDGGQIAFTRAAATSDVWVVPAAGGEPRQLTDWPSQENAAAWSPDGRTLAITSNRDAAQADLWTIPAAGGDARRITRGGMDVDPTMVLWSPDGRTLYFTGTSRDGSRQVFSVPAAGGTPRQVTQGAGAGWPLLSPDGTQLGYSAMTRGLAYLETMSAAGGSPRRFHPDTTRAWQFQASWSPDGSVIAFSDFNYETDRGNIAAVPLPGGEVRRLTSTTDAFEQWPTWTRDGRSLVFLSDRFTSRVRVADVSRLLTAQP